MKKVLSLILSIAMLLTCIPAVFAEEDSDDFLLATVSDIHYYPETLATYKSEAFYTYMKGSNAVYDDLDAIIDSTFAALAKDAEEKGLEYVVIDGDLTTNGEYEGHKAIAEKLRVFEEETGLSVLVTNGNHDINNSNAAQFTTPDLKKTSARITTPNEFYTIYKDFGFDKATATYAEDIDAATKAGIPGALSYSVCTDGYRLIMIDAGKYSALSTKSGEDEHETAGCISEDLLKWVLDQAAQAEENGETPIAFTHWNLSEMNYLHGNILTGFVIDDAYKLQETFADAGIHFAFSGHQHASDTDITYSDSGEMLCSCIIPTLTQYPFQYRETLFSTDSDGKINATYNQYSCDKVKKVKAADGTEYEQPYYLTTGCKKQLGDNMNATGYLMSMIKNMLSAYVAGIQESGSIVGFIKDEFGFDLEGFFTEYIKDGLTIGNVELFTVKNIMNFINDLDTQIYSTYISNPDERLWPSISDALDNVLAVKISDVPCTKFIDTYGFGSETEGGTIGDLFFSALVYMYPGNEDISDDLFIQDVLTKCGKTEFVDLIFDTVIEYVAEDLVIDEIFGKTEIHLDSILTPENGTFNQLLRGLYSMLVTSLSTGFYEAPTLDEFIAGLSKVIASASDTSETMSLKALIEGVLETELIPYGSTVNELFSNIVDIFLTDVQKEAAAYQIYVTADSLFNDDDRDWDVTYSYEGPVEVTPTVEDMQLPSELTMTFGSDASASINFKWLTKYSVTGTDIEIVPADSDFTGIPTLKGVETSTESSVISGNGFDFGTFGIMPWSRDVNIHTVSVTGLKAGTKYKYRAGDFENGFVCEGTFETAGNDNSFSFGFFSDSFGVTPEQYSTTADILSKITGDNAAFVIDGGNSVYDTENANQWNYLLNGSRDSLLTLPVQYTAGGNDESEENPISNHFAVSAPSESSETGTVTYYSFDYENAHFSVLDTSDTESFGIFESEQLDWLDNDLKNCDAEWKIIVMGSPLYGDDSVDGYSASVLQKLIEDYSVDLVLCGGDTAYSRSYALHGDKARTKTDTVKETVNGKTFELYAPVVPCYITLTGVSVSQNKADTTVGDSRYLVSTAEASPVYTLFTVEDNKLGAETYKLNGDGTTTLIDSFGLSNQYSYAVRGDVNNDYKVTASDARSVLRCAVGLEELTRAQKLICDTDGNCVITSADARSILRCAVGIEKIDPAYIRFTEEDLAKY